MADEPVIANRRNPNGVKDSCDMYRTFNGRHYICWVDGWDPEVLAPIAKAYREHGVPCLLERHPELFNPEFVSERLPQAAAI